MPYELSPKALLRLSRSPFNFPEFFEDVEKSLMPFSSNEQGGLEVSEDNKSIYIKALMPGLEVNQIDINIENGVLLIKGERQEEEESKERKIYRRAQKSFVYQIALPSHIEETTQTNAKYDKGILTITLPKTSPNRSKKITVEGNGN